jgi:acyl-CoA synthetase (AMP-forming)/AMP-acid ligase II
VSAPDDAPAPGTLEHLATLRPDEVALVEGEQQRTRAAVARRANALALSLEEEDGVGPGGRVAVRLPPSIALHELTFALAKLGATPVALPPDAPCPPGIAEPEGLEPGGAREARIERREDGPARLTGTRPPAPTVTFEDGELHVRTFTRERTAALGATVADLLDRLGLRPNAVHLMAAPAHVAGAAFHANVALVGGGAVVSQPAFDPQGWLGLVGAHGVTTAFVTTAMLEALTALDAATREAADLTSLDVVVAGAALPDDLRAAARDLLGEDVLHEVHGTPRAGDLALRGPHDDAFTALAGVELTQDGAGGLLARSPLAADPSPAEPVPAGPGRLAADGTVETDPVT